MKSTVLAPILFSTLFFLIIDLLSWQAIRHLLRNKRRLWLRVAAAVHFGLMLAVISILLYYFLTPQEQRYSQFRTWFSGFVMSFYVSKLVFSLFVLLESIMQFFKWVFGNFRRKTVAAVPGEKTSGMSRGDFLYSAGTLTATVPFYFMMGGMIRNAYDYKVRKVRLEIPGLPAAFHGMRLVQVSDIHAGSLSDKDAVYRGVKMINDLKPDLFMFTGDLVNNFAWEAVDFADMFRDIKADIGAYSILGNHDYGLYASWESDAARQDNFDRITGLHREIGWQLMRNEHEVLSRNGQKLALIGVENWGHSLRFPRLGDIGKASAGMPSGIKAKLLMSHDPSHWDAVVRKDHRDISAMFAGHTHGAQFGIENSLFRWSPVQYIYKQWAGLYTDGRQQLYVNRGFGFIGYPGRVGILPEITLFELA
jgi:predicted MPP superfamily phosphohydrolase